MRVLVTGYDGQLGYEVINHLEDHGVPCRGVDVRDFDLTDATAVNTYVSEYRPDAIIHCAAFTAVDQAETARDLCFNVNVVGTENLARACLGIGAKFMYLSTDYVFDGAGESPFEVSAPRNPLNYYGQTKAMGEQTVMNLLNRFFIVRSSWIFGRNGQNFVKTMLRLGNEKPVLEVVADQIGSPTYAVDLAALLVTMIGTEQYGIYHATNEGYCSWAEFAEAIMTAASLPARIKPIASEQFPAAARRPKNSRLAKTSLDQAGFSRLPPWPDALNRYLQELASQAANVS